MAKVKSVQYRHLAHPAHDGNLMVNVDGEFYIKLPDEVAYTANTKIIIGKDMDRVIRDWKDVIQAHYDSKIESRKVIFFKSNINATIWDRQDSDGSASGHRIEIGDTFFSEAGIEIALQAGVFTEETIESNGKKTYKYTRLDTIIPKSMQYVENYHALREGAEEDGVMVLEWTEERERRIAAFCFQLETLVLNITEFTKSSKKFAEVVDSGTQLLLSSGKGNKNES